MYLLDTNVVSQLAKREPNTNVVAFMESARDHELCLSVLTIGEIRKGIDKLTRYRDHDQAEKLRRWLDEITSEYSGKILPIDIETSELWGAILATTDDTNAVDKLIAATALQYGLTLATRNVVHLAGTGVKCINPFLPGADN